MKHVMVPSTATPWVCRLRSSRRLALILATLSSGFLVAPLVPAWAHLGQDHLGRMLGCGVLALALALVLAVGTSLSVAVVALVVFGGPDGVGISLLDRVGRRDPR